MIRNAILALALGTGALAAAPLLAQVPAEAPASATPLEAGARTLVTVINATAVPEEAFTAGLLAQVPYEQIAAVTSNLTGQFGPATAVEAIEPVNDTAGIVAIRLEQAVVRFRVSVDPGDANRLNGLFVYDVTPIGDTPEKIAADLAALPGSVNAWFGPLGSAPVISRNPDTPLALGSTFKLYVLAALAEDVKAGTRKWSDVVPLAAKSFPSGQLQNWPTGVPITLHTLASLMISISDNTATDRLIAVLGKDRIVKWMADSGHSDPGLNTPLLTTRELFGFKAYSDDVRALWRTGGVENREAAAGIVSSSSQELTLDDVNAAFAKGPQALDIEWFASPTDLAKMLAHMRKTADPEVFAIMAINPSATPSIKANWRYIGFKGGSEPGVLNLTWLLTDKDGRDWVLTLGWNNPSAALEEGKLEAIAQRILLLPR